jgi:hypothetical protein
VKINDPNGFTKSIKPDHLSEMQISVNTIPTSQPSAVLIWKYIRSVGTEAIEAQFRAVLAQWPVPVAARSKACVCDRSPPGIVGSNPTGEGGEHSCLPVVSVVCCQVEVCATS